MCSLIILFYRFITEEMFIPRARQEFRFFAQSFMNIHLTSLIRLFLEYDYAHS